MKSFICILQTNVLGQQVKCHVPLPFWPNVELFCQCRCYLHHENIWIYKLHWPAKARENDTSVGTLGQHPCRISSATWSWLDNNPSWSIPHSLLWIPIWTIHWLNNLLSEHCTLISSYWLSLIMDDSFLLTIEKCKWLSMPHCSRVMTYTNISRAIKLQKLLITFWLIFLHTLSMLHYSCFTQKGKKCHTNCYHSSVTTYCWAINRICQCKLFDGHSCIIYVIGIWYTLVVLTQTMTSTIKSVSSVIFVTVMK